jgi:hypothetical protein
MRGFFMYALVGVESPWSGWNRLGRSGRMFCSAEMISDQHRRSNPRE